jgi:hypothetical protein
MRIPSGVTDQYIYFVAVDATDFTTREPGLSGFTVYRSRNGGTATAMTTPTITELDATNMPGVYGLLLDEDMTIGTGNDSEEMAFHIKHASIAPVTRTIEIYRPKITAGNTLGVNSSGNITAVAYGVIDAIWDEPIAGHLTAGSEGLTAVLGTAALADTTVTGTPTTTTIQLTAGSSVDGFYDDQLLYILSGTGVGEVRVVTNYVGSTKTITVDEAFNPTPGVGDRVVIAISHVHPVSQIKTAIQEIFKTDTSTLPGQEAPTATPTLEEAIIYLYKAWRNKKDNDGSTTQLYADDATTVDQKQTTSSAAGTVTKGEWESGP